jgi:hypothetical protein
LHLVEDDGGRIGEAVKEAARVRGGSADQGEVRERAAGAAAVASVLLPV